MQCKPAIDVIVEMDGIVPRIRSAAGSFFFCRVSLWDRKPAQGRDILHQDCVVGVSGANAHASTPKRIKGSRRIYAMGAYPVKCTKMLGEPRTP